MKANKQELIWICCMLIGSLYCANQVSALNKILFGQERFRFTLHSVSNHVQ